MASDEASPPERWTYTGPDGALVLPRNLRGINGRVEVSSSPGRRVIKIDELMLDVPQGLAWELSSALGTALRPYAGFSIFEHIMTELDSVIDSLMEVIEEGDEEEASLLKIEAATYANCLAIIRGGRNPDVDFERERAMERWEARRI